MSAFDYGAPAGLRDADIEYANLVEIGKRSAALRKRGVCIHSGGQGMPDGTSVCSDCGKVFPSSEAQHLEYKRLLYGD